ncbi:MAG: hypothetical protein IPL35_10985 [Sphingobacteriales bacterium]|nr:hypothetical protein [Sphingobacteriales bacterium]
MKEFMVEIALPQNPPPHFWQLIPEQRKYIAALFDEAKLLNYSLSADRSRLWVVLPAENEDKVREIIENMPLYDYFEYRAVELMFHENISFGQIPMISLN